MLQSIQIIITVLHVKKDGGVGRKVIVDALLIDNINEHRQENN